MTKTRRKIDAALKAKIALEAVPVVAQQKPTFPPATNGPPARRVSVFLGLGCSESGRRFGDSRKRFASTRRAPRVR
jgi:hypothetical protein